MAKVKKRDGRVVDFDKYRIVNVIIKAMSETVEGIDEQLAHLIAQQIEKEMKDTDTATVEDIQDMVEQKLMDSYRKDVAKQYIIYRSTQSTNRKPKDNNRLLSDDFISKYKHALSPMKQLGSFVYYRTYSRYLNDEKRREYWWETARRAVEYNCSLVPNTPKEEAEALFDNVYNLRQFLSGRTFWVGGTTVADKYPMANFNCAFKIINSFESFRDVFYLLMVGTGVGVRILKDDVSQLPRIRTNFEIIHKDYYPLGKNSREDMTSIEFADQVAKITIGDSKEGWVQSLGHFLDMLTKNEYKHITTIILDYDNVRPKGEKLKTFGGTASGHESLKNMFKKIDKIIKKAGIRDNAVKVKLRPVDCLDIANIIGENVVVGGVRRTAEIALIDQDDKECVEAKTQLYELKNGKWEVNSDLIHRQMSNNSIYYKQRPTREQIHWQIEQMRYSGEPAFVNEIAGAKRRPNMNGVNPCAEILLDNNGLCNLTTLNVYAFVRPDKTLDLEGLLKAQKLSVRAGYRMTMVELELHHWNLQQQKDKLVGCSLTGWKDMVNALGYTKEDEIKLLQLLRDTAHKEVEEYAKSLGLDKPLLTTTLKPEGTLSQLPIVSSGIHYPHSAYFIRRVRINAHDPLVKVCEELGYPVYPEVNQEWETCNTKVVEFPVSSPEGRTKYDVSAIEQLEDYKMFMEHYVDHNASITVHVRNDEWEAVEQWVYDNWDDVVAVSFLSLDDNFYKLMPYEAISEEDYNDRVSKMKPFIPSLISKYEVEEVELDLGNDGCSTGVCPTR